MTKTGSSRQWILTVLILLVTGTLFGIGYYKRSKWHKDHVLVELKPIQVGDGWGYDILADGHKYIHQPFIPAISGTHLFKTKDDALRVGKKVYDRLMAGDMPMVSLDEVRAMGLDPNPANPAKDTTAARAQQLATGKKDSSLHK